MQKYSWTVDTLIDRLNYLESLNTDGFSSFMLDVVDFDKEQLKSNIEELQNPRRPVEGILNQYNLRKEALEKVKFFFPFYQEFLEKGNSFMDTYNEVNQTDENSQPIIDFKTSSLSKDDIIELTHDFFKNLNSKFYKIFLKPFNYRYDHTIFLTDSEENLFSGETFHLICTDETFINVYRDSTINDLLIAIHEYTHAICLEINPYDCDIEKGLFVEISTLFMELVAQDYITNTLNSEEGMIARINRHLNTIDDAILINLTIALMDIEKNNLHNFQSGKEIKRYRYLLPEDLRKFSLTEYLNLYYASQEEYLDSYMYAVELYEIYKNDPDKAFYYLNKIIRLDLNTRRQYYNNIKRFGLTPNLSQEKFQEELTRDLFTLCKKK